LLARTLIKKVKNVTRNSVQSTKLKCKIEKA